MEENDLMAQRAQILARGNWQVAHMNPNPWERRDFGGRALVARALWHAYDKLSDGEWPVMFCHQLRGGDFVVAFAEALEDRKAGRYEYRVYEGPSPDFAPGDEIREITAIALANLLVKESEDPLAN